MAREIERIPQWIDNSRLRGMTTGDIGKSRGVMVNPMPATRMSPAALLQRLNSSTPASTS